MPLDIFGYESERIIHSRAYGDVTLQDLQHANDAWTEMLDKAETGPIHSLIEVSKAEKYPTSIFQMGSALTYLKHPRLGWVIAYGTKGTLVNFVMAMLTQVFGARIRVAETRTEAVAYLRKVDETLPILDE